MKKSVKSRTENRPKAVVFFGGVSVEHDVSVVTGLMTAAAMSKNFDVLRIFVDKSGLWRIAPSSSEPLNFGEKGEFDKFKKCSIFADGVISIKNFQGYKPIFKPDIGVICFHGGSGEGGGAAGLLCMCGIPCINGGVALHSIAMDKSLLKKLALSAKIPVLPHVFVDKCDWIKDKTNIEQCCKRVENANINCADSENTCDESRNADFSSNCSCALNSDLAAENSNENEIDYVKDASINLHNMKESDYNENFSEIKRCKCGNSMEACKKSKCNCKKNMDFHDAEIESYKLKITLEAEKFCYPMIVKPCSLGSSIGVSCVHSRQELVEALETVFCLDTGAMIEPKLKNLIEVNCAVAKIKGKTVATQLEKPLTKGEILDFSDKYMMFGKKGTNRIFPWEGECVEEIQDYSKTIYDLLSGRGPVRADWFVSDGKPYLNEINAVPGSLANYLFEEDFPTLLWELYEQTLADEKEKTELIRTVNSPVLSGKGSKSL